MNNPFGLEHEAAIYLISAKRSIEVNHKVAETQISQWIDGLKEDGVQTFEHDELVPYTDALVEILVNKHKKSFPNQGWDVKDKNSVSWFLILAATAINRVTCGRINVEQLFKDVFVRHFRSSY